MLYHRGYERRFILSEGLCATASIALVVYHGLRLKLRTIDAVLPSALVFVLWRLSQHCNYERWPSGSPTCAGPGAVPQRPQRPQPQ